MSQIELKLPDVRIKLNTVKNELLMFNTVQRSSTKKIDFFDIRSPGLVVMRRDL